MLLLSVIPPICLLSHSHFILCSGEFSLKIFKTFKEQDFFKPLTSQFILWPHSSDSGFARRENGVQGRERGIKEG
ncbi:hypothetical protein K438DRAFT_1850488, partial [Mycena galopus ATCC 62051]